MPCQQMHVTLGCSWAVVVIEQRLRYEGTTATCRYEASNRFARKPSFAIRALNRREDA
jgi:hypothetical protein